MDFLKAWIVYIVMGIVIGAAVLIGVHKPGLIGFSLFPLCVIAYSVAFGYYACSGDH